MCNFFSCISDDLGNIYYFDYQVRKKILKGKLKDIYDNIIDETDSHSSISSYYGLNDDRVNKYEYNPILKKLTVDCLNIKDDSSLVERKCKKLDFKIIVPELIIKKIFNPQKNKLTKVTKKHIKLLKEWDSVWASV